MCQALEEAVEIHIIQTYGPCCHGAYILKVGRGPQTGTLNYNRQLSSVKFYEQTQAGLGAGGGLERYF